MFESYELYTKTSKKNIGEYGITKIDKNFILVIKATRNFIDGYIRDMKYHEFPLDEILYSLTNDSIVDSSSYVDPERDIASIPASEVNSTLMLGLDTVHEVDDIIGWLTYKIECDMWDDLHCKSEW